MSQSILSVSTRSSRANNSTSGLRGDASSPTSPTRASRLQEKEELQLLNDRLACYIDLMRSLEKENTRLKQELHIAQDTVSREVSNVKALYEKELAAARKLLDETAREKAKLQIDIKHLWEENEDLKQKLDRRTKDCLAAENNVRVYESRFNEISGKYNQELTNRKKTDDVTKDLRSEIDGLRHQLKEIRKQLEVETLSRVDLANQNQSLREEISFKDQIHGQELTETRSSRQVEISEINGRLSKQYEAKLQLSLQELRDQYESQIRANREEIELLYECEIKNLRGAANRAGESSAFAAEEIRLMRTKVDSLNRKIEDLENTNAALNGRTRDLENLLDSERARHNKIIASLETELQRMRDEMAHQLQEYQDLMDIKVSLDLEIAAYDKLLCGEECRLNILSPGNESNQSTDCKIATGKQISVGSTSGYSSGEATAAKRGPAIPNAISGVVKRCRTVLDESEDCCLSDFVVNVAAKGDLQIIDADSEGRYIKLHNKGHDDINLTNWLLTQTAGDEELVFKFPRGTKLTPNSTVTIWSVDAGVSHDPPENLVMRKKWPVADSKRSVLTNPDKADVASYDRARTNISSHASRHRSSGSSFPINAGAASTGMRSIFSVLF